MKIPCLLSGCVFAVVSLAAGAQDGSRAAGSRAGIEIVELIARYAKNSGGRSRSTRAYAATC